MFLDYFSSSDETDKAGGSIVQLAGRDAWIETVVTYLTKR